MNNPAWQAIVSGAGAARADSGYGVAERGRAITWRERWGRALGGLMVAGFSRVCTRGAGAVFFLNALFVRGWVIWVLVRVETNAAVQECTAGGADCGIDPVGIAVCAVLADAAIVADPGVYVYVFRLGDLVAAGGGGEAGSAGRERWDMAVLNGSLGVGAVLAATQLPKDSKALYGGYDPRGVD